MKKILEWMEKNLDRICKFTMIAATFFVGLALGVVMTSKLIQPKVIEKIVTVYVPSEPIVEARYGAEQDEKQRDWDAIIYTAKTVWGEYRGPDLKQQAGVVWTILNRVDSDQFPNDIVSVVTQKIKGKPQFEGYNENNPVDEDIVALVIDVFDRYELEKTAVGNVGRVLPKDYLFFRSSGTGINVFRQGFKSTEIWDWKDGTPYD